MESYTPYTLEAIKPKQVIANKDTHAWNMSHQNFATLQENPVEEIEIGRIITVTTLCHHDNFFKYYLVDPTNTIGYSVTDFDNYTEPEPEPEEVEPTSQNIAPPISAPDRAYYEVVKEIPAYISAANAQRRSRQTTTVQPGKYHKYKELNGALNVTRLLGHPGWWINIEDNVPDPEPEKAPIELTDWQTSSPVTDIEPAINLAESKWQTTYRPFTNPETGEREPVMYAAIRNTKVYNLEGRYRDSYLHNGDLIEISGTLVHDSIVYGRAARAAEKFRWDSVDMDDVALESEVYGYQLDPHDKKILGKATWHDQLALILGHVESWMDYRKKKRKVKV